MRPISHELSFQLLVDSVHDYAIYMLNPDGYISSWNRGAERVKGYTADEIIGQHFSRFYTPEEQAAGEPARALQCALDEGKYEREGWRVRKDGARIWVSVMIDPIRDKSGQLLGFAKVTRDITERRAMQEALRESEQRFRLLVQGVTDYALYMLNPEGIISNWNTGAERIKGYRADEVLGSHFSRFYIDEDRQRGLPAHALHVATTEGRFENEGWRVRKDGTHFWAHVVIDAIHAEDGELLGFAKITRDITERRQAAEALEQTRASLAQAQKMEAIGQLTGGVAHDFNNLLTVIVNSLDLLAIKLNDPVAIRCLSNAQRAAGRGAELTRQLLAFARRQPLRPGAHDLNMLIAGFEPILRRACHELIVFALHLAPEPAMAHVDARLFEGALLNLVINARDAMPDGGLLSISTECVSVDESSRFVSLQPGTYVKVSILDHGTGMPAEVLRRAMEPFFTTKEIGKGTGLGLSQVYGFVTQSGGDVVIHSEVGKGTTVELYLPAADAASLLQSSSAASPAVTPVPSAGKVLVVEDESDVLEVSVEIFHSMGYDVITATNGLEAIDVLKHTRDIDVLFTDVVMPKGMSGVDLARFTRKLCPQIKVILASGYPIPALAEEHGALDEFLFVSKPYRWGELMEKMRDAMRKSVH
ncbi:histidine kinase [Noviherbaspirillum autotrophicum]|uniref:histidine kinase n=1 Tax=Noviherbaspirillum autotrophicum TaxID=709839 RepID=A0A0C1Y9Z4_9BURK|nr:histidine kinase [Noviherbaspirillum autotrophicum]